MRASILLLACFFVACGGDDTTVPPEEAGVNCAEEQRADVYVAGLEKAGATHRVRLISAVPAPPVKGDNVWQFEVLDSQGVVVTDATVRVEPWMPDHGHGTPRTAKVTTPTAATSAYYADPVNLWMPGLWEVRFHLTAGPARDTVVYQICIDG